MRIINSKRQTVTERIRTNPDGSVQQHHERYRSQLNNLHAEDEMKYNIEMRRFLLPSLEFVRKKNSKSIILNTLTFIVISMVLTMMVVRMKIISVHNRRFSLYNSDPKSTEKKILIVNPLQKDKIDASLGDNIPLHIWQVGRSRTASTLQFELVCLCQLFQLVYHGMMEKAKNLDCKYEGNSTNIEKLLKQPNPIVVKSHADKNDNPLREGKKMQLGIMDKQKVWVFATARNEIEAKRIYNKLKVQDYNVKNVKEMESLAIYGVKEYITTYVTNIFGLPKKKTDLTLEFMQYWDILRRCCGVQMSKNLA